jgi:hypothetical protein
MPLRLHNKSTISSFLPNAICSNTLSTGYLCTQEEAYVYVVGRRNSYTVLTKLGGRKVVNDSDDEDTLETKYKLPT